MAMPFTAWLMHAAPSGSSVGGAPSRVTCAMEPYARRRQGKSALAASATHTVGA
jgi:hypothetical protein